MKLLKGVEFRLGTEMHTFTAIGRCPRTGRLGVAVTTSEIGTGGRAPHVKANVGAVGTQAYTDPRLGILALQLLELGYPAGRVLSELAASDPHVEWRQLGIVDRWGHTAVRTGASNSEWAGHKTGDGWITMGHYLVGAQVVDSMAKAMEDSVDEDIELRLMRAIDAGTQAGGQPNGQRSAGILPYEPEGFSIINLRVDNSATPMDDLLDIFGKFYPLRDYYKQRPDNPAIGGMDDWAKAHGVQL